MADHMSRSPCRFERGFTLLEALVAVLVLSVGLLGVAGLQLKALQSSHVAYQRSISTVAAQDAVERLWVELGVHSGQCPSNDDNLNGINEWGEAWGVYFNTLNVSPVDYTSSADCEYKVTVGWDDNRFSTEDVSELVFITKLPGE